MTNVAVSRWESLKGLKQDRWSAVALGNGDNYLMQWGKDIQFRVQPLNYHEMDHETGTDWAHKEIAGAAIYREWVGENDELLHIRGNLFPYRIGGMAEIDVFDSYRRQGMANLLQRGDGRVMGWYVCEKLVRSHTFISHEGIGQQIAFEAVMARVPVPEADQNLSMMWAAGG